MSGLVFARTPGVPGVAAVALWALVRQGTLDPGAPFSKRRASPLSQVQETDEDGGTSQRREVRPALVLLGQFTDRGHRPGGQGCYGACRSTGILTPLLPKAVAAPQPIACPQHLRHCHSKPGPFGARAQPSSMTGKPDPLSEIPASSQMAVGAQRRTLSAAGPPP